MRMKRITALRETANPVPAGKKTSHLLGGTSFLEKVYLGGLLLLLLELLLVLP